MTATLYLEAGIPAEPSWYVNDGAHSGGPFAVVRLDSAGLLRRVTTHDPADFRALAAAFTAAADALEAALTPEGTKS
jgi:hypothetical protein